MLSEPRFIYFDLGNVLLFFDHHRSARQMADVAGVSPQRVWEAVFAGDLEDQYESGQIDSQEFHQRFCELTKSQPDQRQLLAAASDIFTLNSALVPLLLHLRQARYPLGILSNTNEAHWQMVSDGKYTVVRDFFPVTALSYEIGCMKPEPAIFAAAAELAGVAPTEIFYTDDRPEHVAAACAAGFDAVLFQDARQLAGELRRRPLRWNY